MRTVFYLMSGVAHCPYLVVSLHTLRKYWDGPIMVFAWEESFPIVRQIAQDRSLGIEPVLRRPPYRGKNDQFLDKVKIASEWGCREDLLLYLDADTSIHGKVDPVLDGADNYGFAATQFNFWFCDEGMPRKRILDLLDYPSIPADLVRITSETHWPSVNGGVWATRPDSPVLPRWYEWTMAASGPTGKFIADEKVLHVLQAAFRVTGEMTVVAGGRYNCSPKYQPDMLKDRNVAIYHYHGDSNCRPQKTQKGVDLWWPIYQYCLQHNVGRMKEWRSSVKNRHLDALERSMVICG